MGASFPRTTVGGLSLSRLIVGTNWMLGYSHTGAAADQFIKQVHGSPERMAALLTVYLAHGVDTLMAPLERGEHLRRAVQLAQERAQREMLLVDTPVLNVDDNAAARAQARARIRQSAEWGAKICLIHHASAEQLVNKNKGTIDRLPDYTSMIREAGMIPGLSGHMPELVLYSDANGYDVETYIQIYNCMGFLMQIEMEAAASIIHAARKPVMAIKPMAAGRCTPYVGLSFAFHTLRGCDMVAAGALTPGEAEEDIEISLAAMERRFPNLEKRASPAQDQAVLAYRERLDMGNPRKNED